jgi:hypothetical protein
VMGFCAQGDNIEPRSAVAVFNRYGEMIQAANMQRCVGVMFSSLMVLPPCEIAECFYIETNSCRKGSKLVGDDYLQQSLHREATSECAKFPICHPERGEISCFTHIRKDSSASPRNDSC